MAELPRQLSPYKRTATFDADSIPQGLLRAHQTKAGVWGKIVVVRGRLLLRILEPDLIETQIESGEHAVIAPLQRHEVEPSDDIEFYVEFHREDPRHEPREPV
jgi:tellurite resistance-related uncharacterized protein